MMEPTPRRAFIARSLILASGAAGLVGASSALAAPDATPSAPDASSAVRRFHLDGRRVHSIDHAGARRLQLGDRLSGLGELLLDDEKVGEFYSTSIFVGDPYADGGAGRVEQHTFVLADGLLVGMGVVPQSGAPASFAITGGTGAFAGARGSYDASFSAIEDGGDGVASFDFTVEGV